MLAINPRRRSRLIRLATVLSVLAFVVAVIFIRDNGGSSPSAGSQPSGATLQPQSAEPSAMPDAAPRGWQRVYGENFNTSLPVGSFVNKSDTDWYLADGNPYARTLRSYPDRWGTTKNRSLNYSSKTTDIVDEAYGARGVFRVHGQTASVDGVDRSLGGSFFPVLNPDAPTGQEQMGQTYGRYTVRFRTVGGYRPDSAGNYPAKSKLGRYGTAFLLWPVNDNWAEGEVDYPEMPWGDRISSYVHEIGAPATTADEFKSPIRTDAGWQTATIEWYPGVLAFYLDGMLIHKVTENVPTTAFRWGFQSGGAIAVPPPDVQGYLLVDWITIDAYQGAVAPY